MFKNLPSNRQKYNHINNNFDTQNGNNSLFNYNNILSLEENPSNPLKSNNKNSFEISFSSSQDLKKIIDKKESENNNQNENIFNDLFK